MIFFFKTKRAYELRISDLRSVVCSSDLVELVDQEGIALDQRRLGDLKIEKIPWRARRFHRLLQHAEEVRALKLARADVQADARVDVLPVPCGERPGNGAHRPFADVDDDAARSEEHTSELQSLMRISYAVF